MPRWGKGVLSAAAAALLAGLGPWVAEAEPASAPADPPGWGHGVSLPAKLQDQEPADNEASGEASATVNRLRFEVGRDGRLSEDSIADARGLLYFPPAPLDPRDRAFLASVLALRLGGFTVRGMDFALEIPAPPAIPEEEFRFLAREDFQAWVLSLKSEAEAKGIPKAVLDEALAGLYVMEDVLKLENTQPEHTIAFEEYLARVVSDARVQRGREKLALHAADLAAVFAKFGVPAETITALWGIESYYGRNMGTYRIVGALATLAYAGKRPGFFRKELFEALWILAEEGLTSRQLLGSWAGAMGQCQFMPSAFRKLAVDGNGDGKRDIWKTEADVFASAANYLSKAGWKKAEPWGQEAAVPAGFDQGLADLKVVKSVAAWKALGLGAQPGASLPNDEAQASVIRPSGPGGRAFLVMDNFRVFLSWNRSTYFGTAAGLISDRLAH